MAASVLGTIDKRNSLAINKLVNLISNPQYSSSYYISAEYLAKIDPKNKTLHNTLIDFIQTSSDVSTRRKALNILIEIADDELTARIIKDFQKFLIPEKYEIEFQIKGRQKTRSYKGRGQKFTCLDGDLDPIQTIQRIDDGDLDPQGISLKDNPSAICLLPSAFQGGSLVKQYIESKSILSRPLYDPLYDMCRTNCWSFEEYYELMWFCSNNISYDRFYKAWNKNKLALWHNMFWQKVLLRLKIHTKL